ncbi:YgfZ/GcvT domain-containing protein [Consotaella salsifontis]|uniref:CAF17 C-terminal domain-containing protein n=1 Tax=Consotaella salsifontis TaxID=1365950 RepID=A0A1T4T6I4_9HYPH|nr:folate-binding protein YgfZ [Consotaella salsifontis]SKA36084.1 hypothetical protein SAMN05428963_12030 [Consotaella salsifontis]
MPYARLSDRSLSTVTGEDAEHFLQSILTADVEKVAPGEAVPAALLTPQGKIMFDCLVSRTEQGFRIDCAWDLRDPFAKRLTLYRLRAKVQIEARDEPVFAVWDESALPEQALLDRRFFRGTTARLYASPPLGISEASEEEFLRHRILAGVAEAGSDFSGDEVFPHDVLMDQNRGVSFKKGCFVGQEVVSRMEHRGTARRRLVILEGGQEIARGADVKAGERSIGTVLAASGAHGLALVRTDRLGEARAAGVDVFAGEVQVSASVPPGAAFSIDSSTGSEVE